ncbi:hypothetical protein E2C01_088761 [Portunus trituberculatus]|uniref:Uncharacterized protein n=1 Tax=Portunus trituberculatus TaxID=210409 RepID=A0A5B7JKA6_PORTR|nr:hypothetical protein [Portunus trituberculatus]
MRCWGVVTAGNHVTRMADSHRKRSEPPNHDTEAR